MAIEPPEPDPDRERLEALVAFSRKRVSRALQRMREAGERHLEATNQLERDERALAQWLEANPPAQPNLI